MFHSASARRRLALALLGLTIVAPSALAAQARTQITPFFGSFFAPLPYAKDIDQGGGVTSDERLTNAPALGIRVAVGIKNSLGFEGQATYVFTGRQAKITSGGLAAGFFIAGNAFMASGRFTLHPRRSNFRGIIGAGYQKLGGDAWDEANFTGANFDKTSFGGILGFGVRANVTPRLPVDMTVESYLHSADPGGFGKNQFQADVMLTVGVPIGLGRK